MEKKYGALLTSSTNPQELSLTITAGLRTVLSIFVALGYMDAVTVDSTLEQVPLLVMAGYATWQGLDALWGAVRKLAKLFERKEA